MSSIGSKDIFARNLLFYIKERGVDQKDVAYTIGVSTSSVNDWVKGKKYPRIDKIEKLANYFGIQKSDLIEDKKENPPVLSEDERKFQELMAEIEKIFKQMSREDQQLYLALLRRGLGKS